MRRSLFTALVVAGVSFQVARATTVTSTNMSDWEATLTGAPTEADFTQVLPGDYSNSTGLTITGVNDPNNSFTFTGPDGIAAWSLTAGAVNGNTAIIGGSDSNASIMLQLPDSGENAVLLGLDSTGGTTLTVTLSDGEVFTSGTGELGLSISHPISWLTVSTDSGSQAAINDFWYGASSLAQDGNGGSGGFGSGTAASEGLTLILVASGLGGLGVARKKLVA